MDLATFRKAIEDFAGEGLTDEEFYEAVMDIVDKRLQQRAKEKLAERKAVAKQAGRSEADFNRYGRY